MGPYGGKIGEKVGKCSRKILAKINNQNLRGMAKWSEPLWLKQKGKKHATLGKNCLVFCSRRTAGAGGVETRKGIDNEKSGIKESTRSGNGWDREGIPNRRGQQGSQRVVISEGRPWGEKDLIKKQRGEERLEKKLGPPGGGP